MDADLDKLELAACAPNYPTGSGANATCGDVAVAKQTWPWHLSGASSQART